LRPIKVHLPYKRGDLLSMMHERGQVESEEHGAEGITVFARMPERLLPYFEPYVV
jgi:GTP-binding protein HflX